MVRYARYMRRIAGKTQFIVITHRRGTMEEADVSTASPCRKQGHFQSDYQPERYGEGTETELGGACQHLAAGIIFHDEGKKAIRGGAGMGFFDKLKKRSAAASSWTRIFLKRWRKR